MRDDTVGVPAAVSVMSVVQSERPFRLAVDIRGCFTISPAGCVFFFGVRIMLGMNFNYLIVWVRVKGQG